jgi:hypothetical protein
MPENEAGRDAHGPPDWRAVGTGGVGREPPAGSS